VYKALALMTAFMKGEMVDAGEIIDGVRDSKALQLAVLAITVELVNRVRESPAHDPAALLDQLTLDWAQNVAEEN